MASGLPASDSLGPRGDTHLVGPANHERGLVLRAAVAHRGNSGSQMGGGVACGLECEQFVRKRRKLVARAAVAEAGQVYVAVHQARQRGLVLVVDLADVRALRRDDPLLGAGGHYLAAAHQDRAALHWLAGGTSDEARHAQQREVGFAVGHGRLPPPRGRARRVAGG